MLSPTRIVETITVIIPIGIMPKRIISSRPIDVARNCLVTSLPKSIRRGAKLENELLLKLSVLIVALTVVISFNKNKY